MPDVRIRGRVINKITRQPITGVVGTLRKGGSSSSAATTINIDTDGEIDQNVSFSSGSGSGSSVKCELELDKDPGYKYKIVDFIVSTYTSSSSAPLTKDLGVIEMDPYTD